MKFATMREMKTHLSEYVESVQQGEVVVTKNGKPVALLSPLSDEDFEEYLLEHNPLFVRAIASRWRQYVKAAWSRKRRG